MLTAQIKHFVLRKAKAMVFLNWLFLPASPDWQLRIDFGRKRNTIRKMHFLMHIPFYQHMEGESHTIDVSGQTTKEVSAENPGLGLQLIRAVQRFQQKMKRLLFPEEAQGRLHFLDTTILALEEGDFNPQISRWWKNVGSYAVSRKNRNIVFEEYGFKITFTINDIIKISDSPDPVIAIRRMIIEKLSNERYQKR